MNAAAFFVVGLLLGAALAARWCWVRKVLPLTNEVEHYKERAEFFSNQVQSSITNKLEGSL